MRFGQALCYHKATLRLLSKWGYKQSHQRKLISVELGYSSTLISVGAWLGGRGGGDCWSYLLMAKIHTYFFLQLVDNLTLRLDVLTLNFKYLLVFMLFFLQLWHLQIDRKKKILDKLKHVFWRFALGRATCTFMPIWHFHNCPVCNPFSSGWLNLFIFFFSYAVRDFFSFFSKHRTFTNILYQHSVPIWKNTALKHDKGIQDVNHSKINPPQMRPTFAAICFTLTFSSSSCFLSLLTSALCWDLMVWSSSFSWLMRESTAVLENAHVCMQCHVWISGAAGTRDNINLETTVSLVHAVSLFTAL